MIAFGSVATISSYFTIDYGKYFTDQVSRKLQHTGTHHGTIEQMSLEDGKEEQKSLEDGKSKTLHLADHEP